MLEDVVDDDLLRLVRVHPGERVHVDDGILESNQGEPQRALQGLRAQDTKTQKLKRQVVRLLRRVPGSYELREDVLTDACGP